MIFKCIKTVTFMFDENIFHILKFSFVSFYFLDLNLLIQSYKLLLLFTL